MKAWLRKWLGMDTSAEVEALKVQRTYLIKTIRDMDQEIWNMAQKTSWEQQRPHFVKLQDGMTARKYAENERINSLVMAEIETTYTPETKQISRRV